MSWQKVLDLVLFCIIKVSLCFCLYLFIRASKFAHPAQFIIVEKLPFSILCVY